MLGRTRQDLIVPVTVELVATERNGGIFLLADLATLGVSLLVQPAVDFQSRIGACRTHQVDDDFMSDQRHAAPIAGDMAEQPMLDFVPFAGPRWLLADLDNHARGIS